MPNIENINWIEELDDMGHSPSFSDAVSLLAKCPNKSLPEAIWLDNYVKDFRTGQGAKLCTA